MNVCRRLSGLGQDAPLDIGYTVKVDVAEPLYTYLDTSGELIGPPAPAATSASKPWVWVLLILGAVLLFGGSE